MSHSSSSTAGQLLDMLMAWLLSLSTLALVVALGYLSFGLLFSADSLFGAGSPSTTVPAGEYPLILRNLRLGCTVMLAAGVLLLLSGMVRYWAFHETGLIFLLAGLGLFFGMNFLVQSAAGGYQGGPREQTEQLLTAQFTVVGALFMAVGGIHLLVQGVLLLANRQARRPGLRTDISQGAFQDKKPEKQDKYLGPCWSLPYCRDSAKRVCPVLHSRKPCWREGRGCYCDQNIVLMLSGERGPRVPGRSAQGFVSAHSIISNKPKTPAEKRAQCLGCPIYLHRQGQKYRLFAPTVVVAVLATILVNKLWIDEIYPRAIQGLGRALRGFSFGTPSAAAAEVPQWAQDLSMQVGVQWLIVIVACLLAIGYLIHLVEWGLYKMGW